MSCGYFIKVKDVEAINDTAAVENEPLAVVGAFLKSNIDRQMFVSSNNDHCSSKWSEHVKKVLLMMFTSQSFTEQAVSCPPILIDGSASLNRTYTFGT